MTDEEFGGDWLVSQWVSEQLIKKHDQPFFLACGIYRPHEPWFVPKKYFELFPLDKIQLPPGYKTDDLADLPPAARKLAQNRYFAHIQKEGQWKQGVQGYLASIAFADAMVGRVLDALENGPNSKNTIVVLWSDHGWHLGEKQHWQKFTGWRACTRVPLIVRVPQGTPRLKKGTQTGTVSNAPVSLLSLFPTLVELCGLPPQEKTHAPSLTPLLNDPKAQWPHMASTQLMKPDNYSVSGTRYRYIHYDNGDHELYDIKSDPYEWKNLAGEAQHAVEIASLKKHVPEEFATFIPAKTTELNKLKWHPANSSESPHSKPDGNPCDIHFSNQSGQPIDVFRVKVNGGLQPVGTL